MSQNTLTNLALRNQILLDRYKAQAVLDFDKVHAEMEKAIQKSLAALEVDTIDQLAAQELRSVLLELRKAQTEVQMGKVDEMTDELSNLAGFQAQQEFLSFSGLLNASNTQQLQLNAATAKQAMTRAMTQPMMVGRDSTGMMLKPFMTGWSDAQIDRVGGAVLEGWQQGKTVQQVMQRIRGTKAALYKDGLIASSRREAAAMVRTATQHVAQAARMETWANNGDLVQQYEILATLDGRTTQVCRSLDGKRYDVGKGPVPPFHVNCRSTTLPVLGPEWDFLDEGATRSSANGYVDADLTYYDWLKKQDPDFVKEAIGPARAELLRKGGLSAEEFGLLNLNKNFEPLTLKQMAQINPVAFKTSSLEQYLPDNAPTQGKPDAWFEGYRTDYRSRLSAAGLGDYADESFIDKWKQLAETGYDLGILNPGVRKQLQEVARQSYLPEQYIADAHWSQVKQVVDMPVKIRVSEEAVKDVFSGGSLKNVHEVKKTGATAGYNKSYLETRTEAETSLFGGRQPVYAYADTGHTSYQITGYGNIELELDRSKLKDTTFTVGDSIDDIYGKGFTAVPASIHSPTLDAYPNTWLSEQFDVQHLFEVQVFDKVDMSLIKSVTLHAPNPSLQAFLEAKNISYTLVP